MPHLEILTRKPCSTRRFSSLVVLTISVCVFFSPSAAIAQSPAEPEATFNLAASDREIDEGDVVQFIIEDKKYWDPSTGQEMKFEADLSPVEWDFGDGRQDPASAYGLYDMKHWFAEDRDEPFLVQATHQGNTEQINIKVNDVLPVIHSIAISENPREDVPVMFQAAVKDPGFNDDIEYTWDFGGGTTATGPNARHTWGETGVKEVTLAVKDKDRDEPPRTFTFHVIVSDDQYYEDNEFSVFGSFSAPQSPINGLILVGTTGNVTERNVEGNCAIRIHMRSHFEDMSVVLTAHLQDGLVPGNYTIGATDEYGGMHQQDAASVGTFFAEFLPPKEDQLRNIGGFKVGGPFWSDRGHVTIKKFEGGELELIFDAVFSEKNIPGTTVAREVAVMGSLVTEVPVAVTPSDITGTSQAMDIPGLKTLGKALSQMGMEDASDAARNFEDEKYYSCAGQEPEEFEVVAATPDANDVNFNFEDSIVEVEFSQSVDPDTVVHPETLEDNLMLAARSDDGYRRFGGSWMPSKQNPRVVEFVPQARLLPGAVHCVYIAGGENGLRSFTGNVLGGSSLDEPAELMASACTPMEGYEARHAFSTRVEMESIGIALYQRSLLGPHAPLVPTGRAWPAISRVYPWWQDAIRSIHPSAAVKTFDARIYSRANRQLMSPYEGAAGPPSQQGGYFETQVRRPDLYSSEDRRNRKHSIEFAYTPTAGPGSLDYFGLIQPLNSEGAPVDPVDHGLARKVSKKSGTILNIGVLNLEAICASDLSSEECGGGFWEWVTQSVSWLAVFTNSLRDLPINGGNPVFFGETFNITPACPGGVIHGECFESFQAQSESEGGFRRWREQMASQINNNSSIFEHSNVFEDNRPEFDILLVRLPARLVPRNQVDSYINESYGTEIIFYQSDVHPTVMRRAIVHALLKDKACDFSGDASCDQTPVQGLIADTINGAYVVGNVHHAEGNEFGGPLIPLMKEADPEEYPETSYVISAYNYARLQEAAERLND